MLKNTSAEIRKVLNKRDTPISMTFKTFQMTKVHVKDRMPLISSLRKFDKRNVWYDTVYMQKAIREIHTKIDKKGDTQSF